jgi:hypothetical protein
MPIFTRAIAASADDGTWYVGADVPNTTSSYLYAGLISTTLPISTYLRFLNVTLAQGTRVTGAYLSMRARASSSVSGAKIRIKGVDEKSPRVPTTANECNAYALTTAYADNDIDVPWVYQTWYQSVDLTAIVQEVLDRADWVSGDVLMLHVLNNNSVIENAYRSFSSYNHGSSYAVTLTIEYDEAYLSDTVTLSSNLILHRPPITIAQAFTMADNVFGGVASVLADAVGMGAEGIDVRHFLPFNETISLSDIIQVNKSTSLTDSIVMFDASVAEREDWHEARNHPHTTKLYMAVKSPRIVWTGRVLNDRGYNQSGEAENDLVINITGGANVSGFDVNNFLPDLTLWIGSAAGLKDHGICRAKAFDGVNIKVSADMTCFWKKDDYISITDLHDYWPRTHVTTADGSSVTVLKDHDLPSTARVEQPIPIFGPPVCAFLVNGSVTVKFHGGLSYLVQPNSNELYWASTYGISAYAWWFEGAGVTTATGPDVSATYAVAGQYVARLTVTGENGEITKGFRNVFIFNRTGANAPIEHFNIDNFSGSISSHGWECQAEIYGNLFSATTLPPGAQVVIFSEEKFAGAAQTFRFGNPAIHDRENVKLVGWISDTSLTYSSAKTRGASITIQGLQRLLDSRGNFPVYWTQIEVTAPAWSKFDLPDGLTVRKVWYHTIRWHWTLFEFTDVFIPDDHNNYLPGQNFSEGTLSSWLTEFAASTQADWVTDKGGALHIFSLGNYLPIPGYAPPTTTTDGVTTTGRDGASWRQRLYTNIGLTDDDFVKLEVQPRIRHEVARVRVEGVEAADNGWYAAVVDMAPGDIRGLSGATTTRSRQVLGTGGFYGSQGYELALSLYAEESRNIERIRLDLAGNYSFFDLAPYTNWFTLTVSPSGGLREVDWTLAPFWIEEMSMTYDGKTGDLAVSLSCKPETKPDLTLGVYSQTTEVGEVRQIQAEGGASAMGSLLKDIDTEKSIYVPALMGDGGGIVEATEVGKTRVRLFGDPNYGMQVDNRLYDNVNNRPIIVELMKAMDGAIQARVVGLRVDDDEDADANSAKARTVRSAIFSNQGEIANSLYYAGISAYAKTPFYRVGTDMRKVVVRNIVVSAYLDTAAAAVTVTVYHNTTVLGAFGLAVTVDPGTVSQTLAVAATLVTGDLLAVTIADASNAYDLLVNVECVVYGV